MGLGFGTARSSIYPRNNDNEWKDGEWKWSVMLYDSNHGVLRIISRLLPLFELIVALPWMNMLSQGQPNPNPNRSGNTPIPHS